MTNDLLPDVIWIESDSGELLLVTDPEIISNPACAHLIHRYTRANKTADVDLDAAIQLVRSGFIVRENIGDLQFDKYAKALELIISLANKPAEVDLDALKRGACKWYTAKFDNNEFIGMPSDREVMFGLLDYLHSSGHLATGKGGGEPAAPTQIDAGELELLARSIDHVRKIENDIRVHGHHNSYSMRVPAEPEIDSDFAFSRVLDAARAHLEKSKGGV